MKGEIVETEAVDCFSWAKRNPFIIQSNPEEAGITLRMKIDHGTFDFRKIKKRPIKVYVTCFSAGVFLQRGSTKICKLLPKKRHAEYSNVDSEVLIPVSWNNTNIPLIHPTKIEPAHDSSFSDRRLSEDNSSPDAVDNDESNSMQIMNSYDVDMSPSYEQEQHQVPNTPIVYNSHLHVHMRDFENEPYMLLVNGNAEVVGNFRALNFYKASDINLKEDIRLLVEDRDPREALLKIDGVEYKFKAGVGHTTNKRFIGYIAQQIESIVPEAVQLIDGILHVDYESLIPYLSESVKQNYNDIKNVKSEAERVQKIVDLLYAEFLKKSKTEEKINGSTSKTPSEHHKRPIFEGKRGLLYSIIGVALVIGAAIGIFLALTFITSGTNPDPPTAVIPTQPISELDPSNDDPETRAALIDLYTATNGPNWNLNMGWLKNISYCSWYGLFCNEGRNVNSLRLHGNNLVGTIPESIAVLKDLVFFEIRNNSGLTGTLPARISDWRRLKEFDVSYNQLTGQLPKMNSLELDTFIASNNRFEGTVPMVKATNFVTIALDNNLLNGSIYNLKDLNFVGDFKINNNGFTGDLILSKNLLLTVNRLNVSNNLFETTVHIARYPVPQTAINLNQCDVSGNAWDCPIPSWMRDYCKGNCNI
eukprot:TRINITY_DN6299_c0_g1_i1.p1 TRINITY_DN6299_c0_g1~~TRINITY_DN6299_c0_g1_i1.p1  ORF type:complete len:711 (-),score=58.51 TRINITY_DN6299_c0_g1_i1:45-1979(-)